MEHILKVEVSYKFSPQEIADLMVTALEGGINYWCGKARMMVSSQSSKDLFPRFEGVLACDDNNVLCASDVIAYGGKLVLRDIEDPTEVWVLDSEKMLKGIGMYCSENNISPSELMDDYDADTADAIVQYGLFNELVYC